MLWLFAFQVGAPKASRARHSEFVGVLPSPESDLRHMWLSLFKFDPETVGVPTGIRTPVTAVKGRCPRPLDDGDCGCGVGWWR